MALIDLINTHLTFLPEHRLLKSFILLVAFYVLSQLIVIIFEKIFLKIASRTKTDLDDQIVKVINRPLSFILLMVGIWLAVLSFGFAEKVETGLVNVIVTLVMISIAFIISGVLNVIINNWGEHFASKTKSTFDDALLPIFHRFVKIVVYILALLYILDFWGVEIAPLLASLGIAGLAIAFALQKVLGNIFGGISMILDKSLKVGDTIKINDGQLTGKVLDVGLRSTKIMTFDNEVVVVPNGTLADSQIQNLVLPDPSARVTVDFGVEYGSDPDKVKVVALKSLKGIEGLIKDDPEPFVKFINMGDFALNFRLFFYVESYTQRFAAKDVATTNIYNNLKKAKIGIPFPTRTIYMKKGK
ncbi:MAG: mechanosensitive ion channel domain-containing protein [Candidatus Woesearchaeota archaeon]